MADALLGQWAFISGRLAHVWIAHKPEAAYDRRFDIFLKLCGNGTCRRYELEAAANTSIGEKCLTCEKRASCRGMLIMKSLPPSQDDLQLAWP